MSTNPAPEAVPSSSTTNPTITDQRKKRFKKGKKNQFKQNHQLKGATTGLGNNFFFTAQDDPSCRSDHFKSTMETIYRHMSIKVEYPQDLAPLFEDCECPTVELPDEPMHPMTYTDQIRFNLQMKSVVKREAKLEQNLVMAFNLQLGQCGHHMRAVIEHDEAWEETLRAKDPVRLSRMIRRNCHQGTLNRHPALAVLVARLRLYTYKHKDGQTVQDYVRELTTLHEVLLGMDGGQGVGPDGDCFEGVERMFNLRHGTRPDDPDLMEPYNQALKEFSDNIMFAMIALRGSNPSHFKALKAELQNQHNLGNNQYPTDITMVMRVLQNYVAIKGAHAYDRSRDADMEGLSFSNRSQHR